uniref:Uncharacterized protein n=1 Tax=Arundo donax TaxID=35708 RepID=A0A0A9HDN0_ARUDO
MLPCHPCQTSGATTHAEHGCMPAFSMSFLSSQCAGSRTRARR